MKHRYGYILMLLLLILALPWSGLAQESQQAEKSPESLELPDVIVYGTDTSLRQEGEKCAPSPFVPSAIAPVGATVYPMAAYSEGEITFSASGQVLSDRHTFLSSYIGPYTSWGMRAVHQRMLSKANLRLFADLEGTDGQHDNGGGTWGEIQGRVNAPISDDISGGLDAGYRRWSYRLYGSPDGKAKIEQDLFSCNAEMETRQSEYTSMHTGLGYRRFTLAPAQRSKRYEDIFQGELGLETRYRQVDILSSINWTGDRPSVQYLVEPDAFKTSAFDLPSGDLLAFTAQAKSQILTRLSVRLGGTIESFLSEENNDYTRFFPQAEACLRPVRPLAVHVSLSGGFRYLPLAELLEMNPYASLVSAPVLEEDRWQIKSSVEAEVKPKLFVKGAYELRQRRDAMYWQWNTIGYFSVGKVKDVREHRLDLSVSYTLLPHAQAQIGYTLTNHDIRDRYFAVVNRSDLLPFQPRSQVWGTAEYSIPEWFDVKADLRWTSRRISQLMHPYDSFLNSFELDPFLLVNVELERNVHKNIAAFIYLRNLADSDYALWYNYSEMGINIYGGVKIVL